MYCVYAYSDRAQREEKRERESQPSAMDVEASDGKKQPPPATEKKKVDTEMAALAEEAIARGTATAQVGRNGAMKELCKDE